MKILIVARAWGYDGGGAQEIAEKTMQHLQSNTLRNKIGLKRKRGSFSKIQSRYYRKTNFSHLWV